MNDEPRPRSSARPRPGLVLYVSVDPQGKQARDATLSELIATLQEIAAEIAPSAEKVATLAVGDDGPSEEVLATIRARMRDQTGLHGAA